MDKSKFTRDLDDQGQRAFWGENESTFFNGSTARKQKSQDELAASIAQDSIRTANRNTRKHEQGTTNKKKLRRQARQIIRSKRAPRAEVPKWKKTSRFKLLIQWIVFAVKQIFSPFKAKKKRSK